MRAPDEVVRTDAKHIKTRQIIMAKEKISLGINLRQNKNSKNAGYGKYYPEVDLKETLTMRGFAEHMEDHGSFFPRYVIEGVLNQICECLPELVGQGVPVKLGSLGTFYPTAEVAENAAVESIAAMDGSQNQRPRSRRVSCSPFTSLGASVSASSFGHRTAKTA